MAQFTIFEAADVSTLGKPSVMMNMNSIRDWHQPRFIDWMKQARGFTLPSDGGAGLADTYMTDGVVTSLPGGETQYDIYIRTYADDLGGTDATVAITWDGTGTVTSSGLQNVVTGSNSITGDYSYANGVTLSLHVTPNFSDPPRNFKCIDTRYQTEYDAGQIFNPDVISQINWCAGPRLMDWGDTNNNPTTWAQRNLKTHQIWNRLRDDGKYAGLPLQVQCDYVAALGSEVAWFNIPAEYSDADITAWATELKTYLPAGVIAIVELSNEPWNNQFDQDNYFAAQAVAEGWPGLTTGYENYAYIEWHAKRSTEMVALVKADFGAVQSRLRFALNVWTAFASNIILALDAPTWEANDPGNYVAPSSVHDFMAITCYLTATVGSSEASTIMTALGTSQSAGAAAVIDNLTAKYNSTIKNYLTTAIGYAKQRGMRSIIYEANNHAPLADWSATSLYSGGSPAAGVFAMWQEAIEGSGMAALLDQARDDFRAAGGTYWNQFADFGAMEESYPWGIYPWVGRTTATGDAVEAWNTANPRNFFR